MFLLSGLMLGDATGSSLAVSIPATLLSNGFSRDHEREADRYAFALLRRYGKSPQAFASLMSRMMQAHGMEGAGEGAMGGICPPIRPAVSGSGQPSRPRAQAGLPG